VPTGLKPMVISPTEASRSGSAEQASAVGDRIATA
jgi:hypothetical protein